MIREFTDIIASLYSRGFGKIVLSGKEIFVFTDEKSGKWQIATKVSSKGHPDIKEALSYSFTPCSSLAIKDYAGRGIYFLYTIPAIQQYGFFKKIITLYLEEVDSFCKIFK